MGAPATDSIPVPRTASASPPRNASQIVEPRRPPGLAHPQRDRRTLERPTSTGLEGVRAFAPDPDHGRRSIGLVARHLHQGRAQHLSDLTSDGGEHIRRCGIARYKRRDPTEGVLLFGQAGFAFAQRLLGTPPLLDVGESDHSAAAVRHVDRRRNVRHREHRSVAPEEPIELAPHRLTGLSGQEHRAVGRRIRAPIRVPVVDRLMAVASQQFFGTVVSRAPRSRLGWQTGSVPRDPPPRAVVR